MQLVFFFLVFPHQKNGWMFVHEAYYNPYLCLWLGGDL